MIVPREINDNVLCDFLHHKQTFYTAGLNVWRPHSVKEVSKTSMDK